MAAKDQNRKPGSECKILGVLVTAIVFILLTVMWADSRPVRKKGESTVKKIEKTDAEWKESLSDEEYRVLRKKGTERPFTGEYWNHTEKGSYLCAGCGEELFVSDTKYDAGCGWPSFQAPAEDSAVTEAADNSLGRTRTEVLCSKCGSHLGHVFNDGPKPGGLRYCINSVSLDFEAEAQKQEEIATFGMGCFWCTEALFEGLDGVSDVKVGYMGGKSKDPTYKEVCSGTSGHAEVAQITYDPKVITFDSLLEMFWKVHDPTSLNKQGGDKGTQYRSAIFYHSDEQAKVAQKSKEQLEKSGTLRKPVVTEIVEATEFYVAENYHQDYYENNKNAPYCRMVIAPKLKKFVD